MRLTLSISNLALDPTDDLIGINQADQMSITIVLFRPIHTCPARRFFASTLVLYSTSLVHVNNDWVARRNKPFGGPLERSEPGPQVVGIALLCYNGSRCPEERLLCID